MQFGPRRLEDLLDAALWLNDFARSCCSTPASLAVVVPHPNSSRMLASNLASRLYSDLAPSSGSAKLLLRLLRDHVNRYDAAGHFCVFLATSIIIYALRPSETPCPLRVTRVALDVVQAWTEDYFASTWCPCAFHIELDDCAAHFALVRPILSSSPLLRFNARELQHVCLLVMSAFYHAVASAGAENLSGLPFPFLLEMVGPPSIRSVLVEGLLLDLPFPLQSFTLAKLQQSGPLVVALLEAAFEPSAAGDIDDDDANFEQFASALQRGGVRLLVCQRGVHVGWERALWDSAGVAVLQRAAAARMAPLSALAGAAVLDTWRAPPHPKDLGLLGGARAVLLAGRRLLHLLPPEPASAPPRARGQVTLVSSRSLQGQRSAI